MRTTPRAHHHHRKDSDASRCVACHMPSRVYMVVDRRRDHGFRVPRPDLYTVLERVAPEGTSKDRFDPTRGKC